MLTPHLLYKIDEGSLTNVVITFTKTNLTNPIEYCKHTFRGRILLGTLLLHTKQSIVPPHQSLNMFPCQWLFTKSLDFASSPQSLTYLHKCIIFERSNVQRKEQNLPSRKIITIFYCWAFFPSTWSKLWNIHAKENMCLTSKIHASL